MVALGKVLWRWDWKGRKEKAENFQHSLSALGMEYEPNRSGKPSPVTNDCVLLCKYFVISAASYVFIVN